MAEHHAAVRWSRSTADFAYDTYPRSHEIRFKNGAVVIAASAAPAFKGDAARIDPEEMLVASLSSCHMLTFLALCARKRLPVDRYEDDASGVLEPGEDRRLWMARVTLRPRVRFAAGVAVDAALSAELHRKAHEQCFIANSVKTTIAIEPRD